MKKVSRTALLLAFAIFLAGCQQPKQPAISVTPTPPPAPPFITSTTMKLSSSAFQNNEMVPSQYTCDGANLSPPLAIEGIPAGAKSLALIVDDPDAPAGDWVHWLVWNIKPDTAQIPENSVPEGATQGITDFGKPGWGGPCPPSGVHHYQFKLYALDTILNLPSSAKKADLQKAMNEHTLDQALLVGLYQKK